MVQNEKSRVAIVLVSRRPWMWEYVAANIIRQFHRPEIVSVYQHNISSPNELDRLAERLKSVGIRTVVVNQVWGTTYGNAMASAVERTICEMDDGIICKMDDDDWYGPKYISDVNKCYCQNPDAMLIGKHGFWTMFMDCDRRSIYWEHESEYLPKTSYVAGPTICTPIVRYKEHKGLRYPTEAEFAIDDEYLRRAMEIWRNNHGAEQLPPIYSTGTEEFILCRYVNNSHGHVWKPHHLMKDNDNE